MKKGNIFLIEFAVVMPFLLAFFIYMQPYLTESPDESRNLFNYAEQSVFSLRNFQVDDLDTYAKSTIPEEYECTFCSLGRQISILMLNQDYVSATNLSNSTFAPLIPPTYKVSVALIDEDFNENEIVLRANSTRNSVMAQSMLVSGVALTSKSTEVYILQVRVWI